MTAEVDPLGAQLSTLRDHASRDLLWNGDAAVWAGRAPLLFPIVGALVDASYRLGSAIYHLPRHGFARNKVFAVLESAPGTVVFRLAADEDTLKVYPFRFELIVRFELLNSALRITSRVCNLGDGNMPASLGYHPGFRWPLPFGKPRSAHFIEFEVEECGPIRRIDSAGLLTAERHPTPVVQRRLHLTDALFRDDVVIFEQLESRTATYGSDDGPRLKIGFPDAPYLGVWTKQAAPFICIEPWHGITDPEGFSGDFSEKLGVFVLSPGASHSATMSIELTPNE